MSPAPPVTFIEEPPDAFWDFQLALSPATPVRAVSAAGGLVVAVGDALHMVRPGAQRVRSRPLPADFGAVAVAAEPWSPFRFAVSSRGHVGIYTGHHPYDPLIDLTLSAPDLDITHLAWVRHDGKPMVYLRQEGGEVSRLGFDGTSEVINVPIAEAIASDDKDNLALLALLPAEEAAMWILPAGAKAWDTRTLVNVPVPDEGEDAADWHLHLTVHGPAVAFALDDLGAEVSWAENEDETKHFVSPPAVFQGPLAFQGSGAIFAAYNVEGQVRILRHVRNGGVVRIARFGVGDDWEGTPATVTGLAWDQERRTLWAASPELGLIRLTEPTGKPRVTAS